MSTHTLEITVSPDGQHRGLRLDGTVYAAEQVAEALRTAPYYRPLVEAARAALAVADLAQAARAQLAPVTSDATVGRLLGQLADAETAAWGALASALDGAQ